VTAPPPPYPFSARGDTIAAEERRLQRTCPVSRVRTPRADAWLVTGYDAAVRALEDDRISLAALARAGAPRAFATGMPPELTDSLPALERMGVRDIARREIAPNRVKALEPWVRATARDLLAAVAAGPQPADLVTGYTRALPLAVGCRLVGIPVDEGRALLPGVEAAMRLAPDPEGTRAILDRQQAYFRGVLERPDLPPGLARSLVDAAAARPPDDPLGPDHMAAALSWLFGLANAGPATVLALTLYTLLRRPDLVAELRADPGLAPRVTEEALRLAYFLHTPLERLAVADVEIGGAAIRAGDLVLIAADAANRDPAVFDDPDTFDPHRRSDGHLGFGHGPHFCAGSALARMGLRVGIQEFAERLPDVRPAVPPAEIPWCPDSMDRFPLRLPVHAHQSPPTADTGDRP
jgi:cytochrome P450